MTGTAMRMTAAIAARCLESEPGPLLTSLQASERASSPTMNGGLVANDNSNHASLPRFLISPASALWRSGWLHELISMARRGRSRRRARKTAAASLASER